MNLVRSLAGLLLGRRLPTHHGELRVPGLDASVTIHRDGYGVPYIGAGGDDDAWFALGFCHGQDRAGQLEIILRTVRGTLAEVAGPDGLGIDRLARRVGFRRAAEAQVPRCKESVRRQLDAYTRGINAAYTHADQRKAHELALLGCEPTPWEPADVQGFIVLLCFAVAANWDMELVRYQILAKDGPTALAALDPVFPDWLPVTVPADHNGGQAFDRLAEDIESFAHLMGTGGGSNAWAVSPDKTRTGRPILANDPHLLPMAPAQWYLARLTTPRWSTAGATFVGIPAMVVGHNGTAAWGITAGHADNTDLFLEEIGDDGRSIRRGDDFIPCEVRREVITVKGQADVIEDVLVTPRGPILGRAFEEAPQALSLAATWLEPRAYEGFYATHTVRSAEDLREAFLQNGASGATVTYADDGGNIAWRLTMCVPRRKRGHGNLPLAGWASDTGWEDEHIELDALPHTLNPASGFVASANNQPTVENGGPFLGCDWLDGYRHAAIAEALAGRDDWDVASTMTLQTDYRSVPWREISAEVLALQPSDADARVAVEILREWDGTVDHESVGGAVFELFVADMIRRVVEAVAPNAARWALGQGFTELIPTNLMVARRLSHLVRLLREQPTGYFEGPWSYEIEAALAAACRRLRTRFGPPQRWQWGRVRPLRLLHPFGDKKPLDRLFNIGPIPGAGDSSTISQGTMNLRDPLGNPLGVANLRAVIDVGEWDNSRWVILGGQSGNPLAKTYDDQVPLWQRGEGIGVRWSKPLDETDAKHTLHLRRL